MKLFKYVKLRMYTHKIYNYKMINVKHDTCNNYKMMKMRTTMCHICSICFELNCESMITKKMLQVVGLE